MTEITDAQMKAMLATVKPYCACILHATAKRKEPGADLIVREHARRNFQLKAEGILPVVCPISDTTDVRGIGIYVGTVEEIARVMDDDPGVKAGIFTYELHPCQSFPGSTLP